MQCHDAFCGSSGVTWSVTADAAMALRGRDRVRSTAACSVDRCRTPAPLFLSACR
ncbi:NolM protein [Bradyrhizobium sp. LCT2]|nr:NolM protein [Bradyrhizobium sp. LCT2]